MLIGVVEKHRRQEIRRPRRDTGKSDTAVEKGPKTKVFLSMGELKLTGRQAGDWDDKKASEGQRGGCWALFALWRLGRCVVVDVEAAPERRSFSCCTGT